MKGVDSGVESGKKNIVGKRRYADGHWALTLMVLPAMLLTFVFCYIPMPGIVVAFKNLKFSQGIWGSAWCGTDNFKFLFESNTIGMLLRNTIGYNVAGLILNIVFPVFFALCLERIHRKLSIKVYQSAMFMPYFLSWIVVSYFTRTLFDYDLGIVNKLIEMFGGERTSFYTTPAVWPFILIFFAVWKALGYNTLVYYGQLLSIDPTLYEAAEIDGCGYFQKVRNITLPHLVQPILILLLLSIGNMFRSDYGLYYFLPEDKGALIRATDVLDTYVIRTLRTATNMGLSSAISALQSVVGFILVLVANWLVRIYDKDSALF